MDTSSVTRRRVLQTFGAIGGSSLVMAAMNAWGLMGTPAGPRPILQGRATGTRVLVLGAGLSGLTVGYELGKLGYDYQILEAREWVGGLCWPIRRGASHQEIDGERQVCQFDDGQYLNGGAWRIPNTDTGVLGYCKELSVALEIFVNTSDANYFYDKREVLGQLAHRKVRLREVRADLWGSTAELLVKAMDQGRIDAPLTVEDEERLVDFLVSAGYLDADDHTYRPPASRGPTNRLDLSALLRSGFGNRAGPLYAGTVGPDPVFQPVGGMMEIPLAFQRAIGAHITLEAEVSSVRQAADGVEVVYRETRSGETRRASADYCVCCLPMAVLQRTDIDLSADMALAVKDSRHSDAAKLGVQMKRRFWEEDEGIFGGHLWARDLELGEFSYPSHDYFTEKGVLLGYYGSGRTAGLADMPVTGRVEHVLERASQVHPQMRQEFETAYAVWWDKIPYSRGAYGLTPSDALLAKLSEPDGRVYIGCAGASSRPAWLEGAIQAAWRTVEALHERVMRA